MWLAIQQNHKIFKAVFLASVSLFTHLLPLCRAYFSSLINVYAFYLLCISCLILCSGHQEPTRNFPTIHYLVTFLGKPSEEMNHLFRKYFNTFFLFSFPFFWCLWLLIVGISQRTKRSVAWGLTHLFHSHTSVLPNTLLSFLILWGRIASCNLASFLSIHLPQSAYFCIQHDQSWALGFPCRWPFMSVF